MNDYEFLCKVHKINGEGWKKLVKFFCETGYDAGLGLDIKEKNRLKKIYNFYGSSALENRLCNIARLKLSYS
jgi:hypothetical protein